MTGRAGDTIDYNAFNKPTHIFNSLHTYFAYGADLMRYRQKSPSGAITYYLDRLMEIERLGSAVDYRHYVGDVAIVTKTGSLSDPNPSINYTFRDRLGGISMVGGKSGQVIDIKFRGYDAFGKPRNGDWTDKTPSIVGSVITNRGFTDHEHLDDWQLIHMNGRSYDYNLGRFTSVDPIIQSPGNSQSLNPYSYIMNNPLSGTDPTGYCSVSDTVDECSDSLDSGIATEITDADGKVVGYVGKDSEGNLYVSNNGSKESRAGVQGAINDTDRASPDVDSIETITPSAALVLALQDRYEKKGLLGKIAERLSNFNKLETDADDMLTRFSFCLPNCNPESMDPENAALYSEFMIAVGSGTTGSLVLSSGPKSVFSSRNMRSSSSGNHDTLYHYTDDAGLDGIVESKSLNPSLKANNPKDARYGDGQYLSDIQPGTRSCVDLSNCFLGMPFQPNKFKNFVKIDVRGLNVVKGRDGVYVIPNDAPLDLTGRLLGTGTN